MGLVDRIIENQYFMTAICFLLIPIAVYIAIWFPSFAWAGMIVLAVASVLTRTIADKVVKTFCYLTLGFATFWIAGDALYAPLGEEWRMFSFLPLLMLGAANAIAALVTYNDGEIKGMMFAWASLLAILLTHGPLDTGSVDRFFLTGLLFTFATVIFVKFASWSKGIWYAAYNTLKASIAAGAVYGVIYSLRVFDLNVLDLSSLDLVIATVSRVFINAWWASALTSFFVVFPALALYELLLYTFDLHRVVSREYVGIVRIGRDDAIEQKDPFVVLIAKLEDYFEQFSSYNLATASQSLGEMEKEYYSLMERKARSPLKTNAGRMLIEARGMLLESKVLVRTPAPAAQSPTVMVATQKKEAPKKEALDVPDGTVVLVEGPIGSRKEVFCLDLLKKRLGKGEKAMVVSFEPEKEGSYLGDNESLRLVGVEQNINDMALSISKALEENPKIVFFNLLYWLVPNYGVNTVSGFLASTIKKLKNSNATGVFVLEQEMLSPQTLSTLESVFDGVIEFATVEEGGKTASRYRVKEFKFKKFDTEWLSYG